MTGASGGVGSVAVAILAELGYEVAAVTGRPETADYLQSLGAGQIIAREEMSEPAKPVEKETWAGVVDTVAGPHLAKALAQTRYGGVVSACGLAATPRLECTVMPLLRGVKLIGIDSVAQPCTTGQRSGTGSRPIYPGTRLPKSRIRIPWPTP